MGMGNGTRVGTLLGALLSVAATTSIALAAPPDAPGGAKIRAEKSASSGAPARRRGGPVSANDEARAKREETSRAERRAPKAEPKASAATPPAKDARATPDARASAKDDEGAKGDRAPKSAAAKGKSDGDGEVEGGNHPPRQRRAARAATVAPQKAPCVRDAVHFERGFGGDAENIVLTRCDGRPSSEAIDQLSILVRPMSAARPNPLATRIRRAAHREWLPGVKRIHEGLVTRLQQVVDRFRAERITLVSGYRPTSLGSFHQSARALDVHVEGVRNEALVEFCRTLPDTGCGYYPNSSFVHIDVRPAGTGHVYWIDASGPGEPARYVSSWPPKDAALLTSGIAPPDPAAPLDEQTHPGAGARSPLGGTDTKIDARTTAPWWGGDSTFAP
jgi:hypothetical protein